MKRLVALVMAGALVVGASASAGSRFTSYRNGDAPKIKVVKIRTRCLATEDSAAHLRPIAYGDGVAVYGCSRKGY